MQLKHAPNGSRVATAGAVIVRQRPGTAKGFLFLTLEDETGLSQAIVSPQLFADARTTILGRSVARYADSMIRPQLSPGWKPGAITCCPLRGLTSLGGKAFVLQREREKEGPYQRVFGRYAD
jgi:hypothetical protein